MTPTEYTRHWQAYSDQARAVRERYERIRAKLDERARILGCKSGISGLYCYHNAHNWQHADWLTSDQRAACRRILALECRMWKAHEIMSEMLSALWDASEANPHKRYRQGHRLTGDTRRNFAALGVSA